MAETEGVGWAACLSAVWHQSSLSQTDRLSFISCYLLLWSVKQLTTWVSILRLIQMFRVICWCQERGYWKTTLEHGCTEIASGTCWLPSIVKERQVIIIQEVQVDRQVLKGGAAKGGTYNLSQLITQKLRGRTCLEPTKDGNKVNTVHHSRTWLRSVN